VGLSWTQRDLVRLKATARESGKTQLTGYFRWWWQVLGSNQRRLSRRFYRPRALVVHVPSDLRLHGQLPAPRSCLSVICPYAHGPARVKSRISTDSVRTRCHQQVQLATRTAGRRLMHPDLAGDMGDRPGGVNHHPDGFFLALRRVVLEFPGTRSRLFRSRSYRILRPESSRHPGRGPGGRHRNRRPVRAMTFGDKEG